MIKASDLTDKDVVNITNGKKIGMITDFEVDLEKGRINAIIIPGGGRLIGLFSRKLEYEISWNQIKNIGEDVILIEVRDEMESSGFMHSGEDM